MRRLVLLGLIAACHHGEPSPVGMSLCQRSINGELPPDTLNVRDFGAVGDGVSDDFDAMQAAAIALCATPGSTLVYPPGRYRIDRHAVDWWSDNDGPDYGFRDKAVVYTHCTDVRILGCDAVIDVKGDFHKTGWWNIQDDANPRWVPREAAFIPFAFGFSSHFELAGFEIDGNAELTTADAHVDVETAEHGVMTWDCSDYAIRDLDVHHMQVDGLSLGTGTIDDHVTIERVHSAHNGRAGVALIQVRDIAIRDSVLEHAGDTEGSWGPISPAAGLVLEADCSTDPSAANYCEGFPGGGEVLIERTRIAHNLGTQLGLAHGESSANAHVREVVLENPPDSEAFVLALGMPGTIIERSEIRAGRGSIIIFDLSPTPESVDITIRDNIVHGSGWTFRLESAAGSVIVEDNIIVGEHAAPPGEVESFVWLNHVGTDGEWRFTGNEVFVPVAAARAKGYPAVLLAGLGAATGNVWRTDLGGAPTVERLKAEYTDVDRVEDTFEEPAAWVLSGDAEGRLAADGSLVWTK